MDVIIFKADPLSALGRVPSQNAAYCGTGIVATILYYGHVLGGKDD